MSKFKAFIVKWLVPLGEKGMIAYLESKGFCVCKKEECKKK